jgi:hypothetical protein
MKEFQQKKKYEAADRNRMKDKNDSASSQNP